MVKLELREWYALNQLLQYVSIKDLITIVKAGTDVLSADDRYTYMAELGAICDSIYPVL